MTAHVSPERSDASWLFEEADEARKPDPPYTVSEWADRNRVLASVSSAEPGRWRTSRTPYLREIMDSVSSYSPLTEVRIMKGAQIGMSEAGFNFVGYVIHHAPGPLMYVMPTLDMSKKFSKTRIDPMIAESPALGERIKPARARDSGNTVFSKDFDGGVLLMTGANSAAGLRSMPIRFLVLDEVDAYPASADEEGDPVMLAVKRTSTFIRRKILMLSTPGLKGESRIDKAFREGDRRYYNVPCDACGEMQPITWAQIRWPKDEPEKAAFHCRACDHRHEEHRKAVLMSEEHGARWIPTAEPVRPGLRSYHVSALYSPWMTWEECAREFLAAKDDPALLQPFVNTVLGETWEDRTGETVDADTLYARREPYEAEPLPPRVALMTCGVDVQPDRLELELVGWGRDEESWSIDYQVLPGDPNSNEVWDQLDEYLRGRWAHPAREGGMGIAATCIDTGGANTMAAYRFVRPREGRRVWGIKGYAGKRPVWPKKPSRNNKGKINLYAIGVDAAKEVVTARFAKTGADKAGAGACHFRDDYEKEHFEQLTAERQQVRYSKGHKVVEWVKADKARNEALDCRVYAYSALQGLIMGGIVLNREARKVEEALPEAVLPPHDPETGELLDEPDAPEEPAPAPASTSRERGIQSPQKHAKRRKRRRGTIIRSNL